MSRAVYVSAASPGGASTAQLGLQVMVHGCGVCYVHRHAAAWAGEPVQWRLWCKRPLTFRVLQPCTGHALRVLPQYRRVTSYQPELDLVGSI
jgi:hypothetical protein